MLRVGLHSVGVKCCRRSSSLNHQHRHYFRCYFCCVNELEYMQYFSVCIIQTYNSIFFSFFALDGGNLGHRKMRQSNNSQVNDKRRTLSPNSMSSSSSSCSLSSYSDNSDDYGTDTELIEIDKNRHRNLLNR